MSKMQLMTISPKQAKFWIDNMLKNRPLRTEKVVSFSEDMLNGEWRVNGETLKFDDDDVCTDGQHRLLACIRANTSFRSWVLFGVNRDDVFASVDAGSCRSVADYLVIHGKYQSPRLLAGAIKKFNALVQTQQKSSKLYELRAKRNLASKTALLEYAQKLESVLDLEAIIWFSKSSNRMPPKTLPSSVMLALYGAFRVVANDRDLATDFFIGMVHGADLPDNSSILHARKFLLERRYVGTRLTTAMRDKAAVWAWNRWITNHSGSLRLTFKGAAPLLILGPDDDLRKESYNMSVRKAKERRKLKRETKGD